MSYNKTVWETGDVITAEKLNKNENATGVYSYYLDVWVGESEQVNVVILKEGNIIASPDEVLTIVKNNALVLFRYHDIAFPVIYESEDDGEGFVVNGSFIETNNLYSFSLTYFSYDGQTEFEYDEKSYGLTSNNQPVS